MGSRTKEYGIEGRYNRLYDYTCFADGTPFV